MATNETNFEAPISLQTSDTNSGLVKELPNLYNNFNTIQQQNFQPGRSGLQTDGSIDFGQASSPYGTRPYENLVASQIGPSTPQFGDSGKYSADSPPTSTPMPGDLSSVPLHHINKLPTIAIPGNPVSVPPDHRVSPPIHEHAQPVGPTRRPISTEPMPEHAQPVGPTRRPISTEPMPEHAQPVGPTRRPISTNPYPEQPYSVGPSPIHPPVEHRQHTFPSNPQYGRHH
jgi:hypothetical protein